MNEPRGGVDLGALSASFDEMYKRVSQMIEKESDVQNAKLNGLEKLIVTRLEGADKALEVKTLEMDRRLEELNNLRKQVTDDRLQFMRSDVYEAKHSVLENDRNNTIVRLTALETSKSGTDSKLELLNKLREEVTQDREQFARGDLVANYIMSSDTFHRDIGTRVSVLESKYQEVIAKIAVIPEIKDSMIKSFESVKNEMSNTAEKTVKTDLYTEKIKFYDTFIGKASDRLTSIETRAITWNAAFGIGLILAEIVLHFINTTK